MTRFVSVVVTIVATVVALALSAVGPSSAAPTGGAERMSVRCGANLYNNNLVVGVYAPDYPLYWLGPLPSVAVGSFAWADGSAVFTPDNHVAFVCNRNGSTSTFDGPGWGRAYVGVGGFAIPRGEYGPGNYVRLWTGRALVVIHGDHVVITGVGKLTSVVPFPTPS